MSQQSSTPHSAPNGGEESRTASFFSSVRRIGVVRADQRWIGGVAAGLGRRWDIDPVLVRGVLVVLTLFSGLGLLLYGLGWALLPEERDGRIHLQEALRGRFHAGLAGALVTALIGLIRPGFWWGPGWWFSGWGTVPLMLLLAGVLVAGYWLGRGNYRTDEPAPAPPAGASSPGPERTPPAGAAASAAPDTGPAPHTVALGPARSQDPAGPAGPAEPADATEPTHHAAPAEPTEPPGLVDPTHPAGAADADPAHPAQPVDATEPIGPASTAQHAHEPTGPASTAPDTTEPAGLGRGTAPAPTLAPRVPGPGSTTVRVFVGLALLAAAVLLLVGRISGWDTNLTLLAGGAILAVLGLGILVSGIRGRRPGWLGAWSVLTTVLILPLTLALAVAPGLGQAISLTPSMLGDEHWAPTSVQTLQEGHTHSAGELQVSLMDLPAETRTSEPAPISLAAGSVVLTVPADLDVAVEVRGTGAVWIEGGGPWFRNGQQMQRPYEVPLVLGSTTVRPQAGSGPADIDLVVQIGAGNVRIQEVSAREVISEGPGAGDRQQTSTTEQE